MKFAQYLYLLEYSSNMPFNRVCVACYAKEKRCFQMAIVQFPVDAHYKWRMLSSSLSLSICECVANKMLSNFIFMN